MAKKGTPYTVKAEERDDYSFEFTAGRHKLLMSKTMKTDKMPVTWFSPVELLLAGLGSCMGMNIRFGMEERKIEFSDLKVEVEGLIDEDSDVSGFTHIRSKVSLKTQAPFETVKQVVEEAEKDCTVRGTMEHTPEFAEPEITIEA